MTTIVLRFSPEPQKPLDCGVTPVIAKVHEYLQYVDDKVSKIISNELDGVGERVRKSVIIPFCNRMDCDFISGNGTYCFILRYKLPHERSTMWHVGEDRRPLPGNPGGVEGDEDKWWADVTDEERRIKELLESRPEWAAGPLCWSVRDYKRKQ